MTPNPIPITMNQRLVFVRDIQRAVAEHYGVPVEVMSEPAPRERLQRNTWPTARKRQVAIFLSCELTHHSLVRIGQFFGNRDHSTVSHARDVIRRRRRADPELRAALRRIKRQLVQCVKPTEIAHTSVADDRRLGA